MHMKRAFFCVFHLVMASAVIVAPQVWCNDTAKHSVAEVLEFSERGSKVVLEGVVVREVNFETVLFADETGQIEVLFEEGEHLPNKALEPGQPVLLSGEVESGYKGKKVIDYYSIRILKAPPKMVTLVEEEREAQAKQPKGFVASLKEFMGLPETEQESPTADAEASLSEEGASKSAALQTTAADAEKPLPERKDNKSAALLSTAAVATAQTVTVTKDGSAGTHTVAEILNRPLRGMEVKLEGTIVREVNYETVLFDDGTGQIEVIVDEDEHLPAKALEEGQRILLEGTVQKGFFKQGVYIDYESARLLPGKVEKKSSIKQSKHREAPLEEQVRPDEIYTIHQVTTKLHNGVATTVSGRILLFVNDNEFVLEDETGVLVVNVSGVSQTLNLQEGQQVTVHGAVQLEPHTNNRTPRPKIKAESIIHQK